MHVCEVCSRYAYDHDTKCLVDGCKPGEHWPPLCCPGCSCESYEEMHGSMASTESPAPRGTRYIDRSELQAMLGEGFHAAFRKAADGPQAMQIYRLIFEMGDDWDSVLRFVLEGVEEYYGPLLARE